MEGYHRPSAGRSRGDGEGKAWEDEVEIQVCDCDDDVSIEYGYKWNMMNSRLLVLFTPKHRSTCDRIDKRASLVGGR